MYDLHRLGWNSFQQLCHTITREILGQTVEAYLESNDGGQDGAFVGHWKDIRGKKLSGRFVIQCKFTSRPNQYIGPADISDELSKVRRLVKRHLCDCYVLMTNAGLSGRHARNIEALLRKAGVNQVLLFGSTWIEQQIKENSRLRMLVPRIYGLGDLSQILDDRAYRQARAILESLREDLAKVVVTDAYRKAAAALDKHGFVLLVGEPAAGKTTIASMLAIASVDQWKASVLKLDHPNKVVDHWNPDEPSQFFWLDDAFGVTQYEGFLVSGWNHIFPQIKTMLRRGAKIVMTSRDYIYNRARNELKEGAFPLLEESQVVIDVHDLSIEEKRQILYNHLKLGRQPQEFLTDIKPHLEAVATHKRFIPEIARRLADPFFTKDLYISPYHLGQFVEKREQLLEEVLQGLDGHSKAALALIYMRNDKLESPIALQESEKQALERLDSNIGGCITALDALNGSLVQQSRTGSEMFWRFKHPTIGDAYSAVLAQNAELLGIFVQGSPTEKLIEQITCGDVGIEHAVIIPKSLFPILLNRLREFQVSTKHKERWLSTWSAKRMVQDFLARRCTKDFLAMYLESNPDLLEKVSEPGLQLEAVPEVDLAVRLHELGLLPEEKRKQFVATVSMYAVRGDDLYALSDSGIRSVFHDTEFEGLRASVREQLLPRLRDVRRSVQSDHQSDVPPDEHMAQMLASLDVLKDQFGDDPDIAELIRREKESANQWIAENESEEPERQPRALGNVETADKPSGVRSIFDDVDS